MVLRPQARYVNTVKRDVYTLDLYSAWLQYSKRNYL